MTIEHLRTVVTAGLAAAALAWLPGAHAQHADIGLTVEAGQIVAGLSDEAPPGAEVPIDRFTGRKLFEGHLEDFIPTAPPFVLIGGDDPGFEADAGTFAGNLVLSFTGVTTLGSGLLYWDPGTGMWGAAPGSTTLHMSRSLGATVLFDTTFSAAGVGNDPNAQIGRTDSEGAIHTHIPYTLDNVVGDIFGEVPIGAYLVSMYLSAPGYQSSDPFSVVLNAGLDDEVFEAALIARAVPEPGSYALLLVGIAAIGLTHARRRRAMGSAAQEVRPMRRALLSLSLTALAGLAAAPASADVRHDEGIGFYVGLDGLATFPSGTYAGLANPNAGRLSLLFDHGDHFHGIGVYSLTGAPPGQAVDTNGNNRIPEISTTEPPLELVAGTGAWSGKWISSLAGPSEYRFLGLASLQSLAGFPPGSEEAILFGSSSGRWNGPLDGISVGLQLVSATPGLHVGIDGDLDIFDSGDIYALSPGNDLTFMPVYWVAGDAAAGTYTAELRLVALSGDNTLESGRFYFDFAKPVPEPETYLLMFAGLAAMGWLARRRLRDV